MTSRRSTIRISRLVDHKLELSEIMGTLLKESLNSDVTFVIDGKNFKAHRAILAIHSAVLRKMLLSSSYREALQPDEPIPLPGKRAASFSIFLQYLYTGVFDVGSTDISIAADVLAIAHEYQVESLESSLGETLKAFVNLDTVFTLFQVAFVIDSRGLLNYCREFMCDNARAVVQSLRFADLSEKAVIDILSNDYFAAPEMEILKAICLWHENNKDISLKDIFNQVRFELVSLDGWSLSEVAPICRLLNAYNIELSQAVNSSNDDDTPKRPRFLLETVNLASTYRGALVLHEGRVRHASYMIDGSYLKRHQPDNVIQGTETKIKGPTGFVTIKLAKICYVNSLRIVATNKSAELSPSGCKPDGYKIYTSLDNISWELLADCRNHDCSGARVLLMFATRPLQYIKIMGNAKLDSDSLYVLHFMCPAECSDTEVSRYKVLCQNGQTLMYVASQDREVLL